MSINLKNAKDHRIGGAKAIKYIGKRVYESGFRGYPGLANTASRIAEYIQTCNVYVEPFAGLGRLTRFIKARRIILNDKSSYARNFIKKKYPKAQVLDLDFAECIRKFNGPNTFFLNDPPWEISAYDDNFKAFCDRTPQKYYQYLFELLEDSPAHWFVCCQYTKKIKGFEGKFNSIIISAGQHSKTGFGLARVKIYSNKPFVRYHQQELGVNNE